MKNTHVLLDIREAFGSPLLVCFRNVWLSYCGNHWNLLCTEVKDRYTFCTISNYTAQAVQCTAGGVKFWCWVTNTSKSDRSDSNTPYWLQECHIWLAHYTCQRRKREMSFSPVIDSDLRAWLWPEAMALAWLFLALALKFLGQGQVVWPRPGLSLAWLRPTA